MFGGSLSSCGNKIQESGQVGNSQRPLRQESGVGRRPCRKGGNGLSYPGKAVFQVK